MKRWVPLVGCVALAVGVIVVACDDGDKSTDGSPTAAIGATATPAPSATPRNVEARTGIPEIDTLIDALLVEPARDRRQALRPLFGSTQLRCSFRTDRVGQNPPCRVGEEEGQLVDTFEFDSCGTNLLRADDIDEVVILLASATLDAVYRPPAGAEEPADYLAIIYHVIGAERRAIQLRIRDGLIVAYLFSCTATPEDFAVTLGLTDAVYRAEEEEG